MNLLLSLSGSYAVPETSESRMGLAYLGLFTFHQLLQDLLLPAHHGTELHVHNLGVQLAAHQSCALVVLDVSAVHGFGQLEILAEALLLEVAHRKLVCKREKVQDAIPNVVVLEVVHEVGPVALHLLVARHGAEHNLREPL